MIFLNKCIKTFKLHIKAGWAPALAIIFLWEKYSLPLTMKQHLFKASVGKEAASQTQQILFPFVNI